MMGVIIMQFFMLVYIYIRNGEATKISTLTKVIGLISLSIRQCNDLLPFQVMFGVFIISVNVFSAQLWAETCKKISPIEYVEVTYIRDDVDQSEYVYLPEVLADSFAPNEENEDGQGREQEYGTFA